MAPSPSRRRASCNEKERLQRAYTVASSDFSRAVSVLERFVGVMYKSEYARLRGFSEDARLKSEQARQNLEEHTAIHGC